MTDSNNENDELVFADIFNSFAHRTGQAALTCDTNFVINWANEAEIELLTKHRRNLEKFLPAFDLDSILGTSMDVFHRRPEVQRAILQDPAQLPYVASVVLGDSAFDLKIYALTSGDGQVVGYCTEWFDVSDRVLYQRELEKVVAGLAEGHLTTRGDLSNLSGEFREMMEQLNGVVDVIAEPVIQVSSSLQALALGGSEPVYAQLDGELGALVSGLNQVIETNAQIAETAKAIAQGDLSADIHMRSDGDELMGAFAEMLDSLNSTLGEVKRNSAEVKLGADQVADASQSVSDNSTQSAASLEEINASSENIAEQTRSNAHNADAALVLATEAKGQAESGDAQMKELLGAMTEIERSSNEISKIIKVIDEIAFQTNLLALNAAVEAGRAGEHGKGFAVVAEEVGRLAGRCATAARETTDIIESSIQKVSGGMRLADDTADSLTTIVQQIGEAAILVGTIAELSQEQADGISQINIGLAQVDQVTQRNTADAEEMAAAAAELSAQSERTDQLLQQFQLRATHIGSGDIEITPELMAAFQQFMLAQGGAMPQQAAPRPQPTRRSRQAEPERAPAASPRRGGSAHALMDSNFGRY